MSYINSIKEALYQEAPLLLTVVGVLGFAGTVVMAIRATPTIDRLLEEHEESEPLERAKALVPVAAPIVGMFLISTACVAGSNILRQHRYAAVSQLLLYTQSRMVRWQNEALEELGPKKYDLMQARALEPIGDNHPEPIIIGAGTIEFFDDYSGRPFFCENVVDPKRAMNVVCDIMRSEQFVTLNEYYHALSMPAIAYGDHVGWNSDGGTPTLTDSAYKKSDGTYVIGIYFNLEPRSER